MARARYCERMQGELDRTFLAKDAYRTWKRRVQNASASIRVFTPYLDRLLDRLLQNSNLDVGTLSVVTDLSPQSGALDYRGQLLGVRSLLRRQVEVRSLPRLHAKVLVCDGSLITIGSQNFTSYARASRETTVAVEADTSQTTLMATLDRWYADATPVSLDFVERLLTALDGATKAVADVQAVLVGGFDKEWKNYLAALEAERLRQLTDELRKAALTRSTTYATRLAAAVERTRQREARQTVWAHLVYTDPWRGDQTFRAHGDGTFTRWRKRQVDGQLGLLTLERLRFHAMILASTGQMGFVRIADQQITYVRYSLAWTQPYRINGHDYSLTVRFPHDRLAKINIELEISQYSAARYASVVLGLRFDGTEASLEESRIQATAPPRWAEATASRQNRTLKALVEYLEEGSNNLGELVARALAPFKYKVLGIDDKTAADFFPSGWVQVSVLTYRRCSVLVAMPEESE